MIESDLIGCWDTKYRYYMVLNTAFIYNSGFWWGGGVSKALLKFFKQLYNQNMSLKDRHFLDQIFYGTVYE